MLQYTKTPDYIKSRDELTRAFSNKEITSIPTEDMYKPYVLDAIANIEDELRRKDILAVYLIDTHDPSCLGYVGVNHYDVVQTNLLQLAFNVDKPENILEINLADTQTPLPNLTRSMLAIRDACLSQKLDNFTSELLFTLSMLDVEYIPDIIEKLDISIPGSKSFLHKCISDNLLFENCIAIKEETIKKFTEHIDIANLGITELATLTSNFYMSLDTYIYGCTDEDEMTDTYVIEHLDPHLSMHPYWQKFKEYALVLESITIMRWDVPHLLEQAYITSNEHNDVECSIGFEL